MKCYIKIGIIIVIRFTLHSTRPHDNDNGNDHAVVVKLKGNCSTMEKSNHFTLFKWSDTR